MFRLIAGFVCTWCLASPPQRIRADIRVSVLVFDYAGAGEVVRESEREAGRILAQARIPVAFVPCPSWPGEIAANPVCAGPPPETEVVVHILGASASHRTAEEHAFGFAAMADGRPFATYAGIFYDRVAAWSQARLSSPAQMLGAVLAHEIGHLLLGTAAHSRSGIMAATWDRLQLELLEQGRLFFSAPQTHRLWQNVVRRSKEARTTYARTGRSRQPTTTHNLGEK